MPPYHKYGITTRDGRLIRSPLYQTIQGDVHPGFTNMLLALIFSTASFVAVLRASSVPSKVTPPRWHYFVSFAMISEFLLIIVHRFAYVGWPALYEGLWLCSLVRVLCAFVPLQNLMEI